MEKFFEVPGTMAYNDDLNNAIVVITSDKDLTPEIFREDMIHRAMFDSFEGAHYNGKTFKEMSHNDFVEMINFMLDSIRSCNIQVINV